GVFAAVAVAYVAVRTLALRPVGDLPFFGIAQIDFPEGSRAAAARGMLAGVVWYARVLLWPAGFPFDRNVYTDPVPATVSDPEVVLAAGILQTPLLPRPHAE